MENVFFLSFQRQQIVSFPNSGTAHGFSRGSNIQLLSAVQPWAAVEDV